MTVTATEVTGQCFDVELFKKAVENVWKAAAQLQVSELVQECYDITEIQPPPLESYLRLRKVLQSLSMYEGRIANLPALEVAILKPVREANAGKFGILQVQGRGSSVPHCIAELPDGSIEISKTHFDNEHLVAYLRLPKPQISYPIVLSFGQLLDSSDILEGPGLLHPLIKLSCWVSMSPPAIVLIKP